VLKYSRATDRFLSELVPSAFCTLYEMTLLVRLLCRTTCAVVSCLSQVLTCQHCGLQALYSAKSVVAQIETPKAVEEAVETGMDHMKAHLQIVEVC
jgi:hypothetical protein